MAILVPQVAVNAVTFLMGMGISKDIGTAISSVGYAGESQLNPGSQGAQSTETPGALNPSGAYGIFSWNGPRQTLLQKFATEKGLPVGAVNTQLAFCLTEMANPGYPRCKAAIWPNGLGKPVGTISYTDFIPIFVEEYENPANPTAEIARAQAFAVTLYPAIPAAVAPTPSLAPAPAPAPQPTPLPSSAPIPVATAPAPIPSMPTSPSPPTASSTMDPALAALITQVIEAVISGLVKTALASATPAVVPVVASPVVNSGTSPLVPVANLEQIIAAVIPQILSTVAPKL